MARGDKSSKAHRAGAGISAPQTKRPELRTLTSLRFFAALAVFFDHAAGALWPYLTGHHWRYALRLSELGGSGVTFFFILSGFILTYNYQDRLTGATARGRFWLARFGRIYPVHILTLCLAAPAFIYVYTVYHHWPLKHLLAAALANVFLVQAWIPIGGAKYVTTYNGPSWTLSCEMFFYALMPLILALVAPLRRRGTWALVLVGASAWLGTLALLVLLHGNQSVWPAWLISVNPAMRMIEFLIGVLAGTIFLSRRERGHSGGYRTSTEALSLLLLVAAGPFVLWVLSQPGSVGTNVVFVPFMLLVIWIFAHEGGLLSRLLSRDLLVFLGEISFSFYMIHFLLIEWVIWPAQISGIPLGAGDIGALLALILVLTLISSALLYRWFETPARRLVRQHGEVLLARHGARLEEQASSPSAALPLPEASS